jgi:hypothetical protein
VVWQISNKSNHPTHSNISNTIMNLPIQLKTLAIALCGCGALALPTANAAMIIGSSTNYQLNGDDSSVNTTTAVDVGLDGGTNASGLWTFELPNIDPADLTAANITLAFERSVGVGGGGSTDHLDLFILDDLRATDSATFSADHIAPADQPSNPSKTGYTLLQDNFIQRSTPDDTNVSLSSSAQADLLDYLQNDVTYTAGEYLVIAAAFSNNTNDGNASGRFQMHRDDFAGGVNQLELTVIPEPSASALLAGALGFLLVFRRRRR